jgi:hypothetical protein
MELGFLSPRGKPRDDLLVLRRVHERLLVDANRAIEIAAAVKDLPEQLRCGRVGWCERECLLERVARGRGLTEQMRGEAGAEMQRRIARFGFDRLAASAWRAVPAFWISCSVRPSTLVRPTPTSSA